MVQRAAVYQSVVLLLGVATLGLGWAVLCRGCAGR